MGRRGIGFEIKRYKHQFNNKQVMGMCIEHKEYGQQYYNNLVWGLMTLEL